MRQASGQQPSGKQAYPQDSQLLDLCSRVYLTASHSVNELEYSVIQHPQCQVVVIRGTELSGEPDDSLWGRIKNIRDVIRDVRVLPWKTQNLPLGHSGFVKGAEAIYQQAVPTYIKYGKPVILTGHSLGGAVAVALGVLLKAQGFEVRVVGFGTPKVFFRRHSLNCRLYRYGSDPVTRVPFGRHPVSVTAVGPKRWFWCIKDHFVSSYQLAKHQGLL